MSLTDGSISKTTKSIKTASSAASDGPKPVAMLLAEIEIDYIDEYRKRTETIHTFRFSTY